MCLRQVLRNHLVDLSLAIGLQPHFDPLQYSAALHENRQPSGLFSLAHDALELPNVAMHELMAIHDHDAVTFAKAAALGGTLGRDGDDPQTGTQFLDQRSEVAASG